MKHDFNLAALEFLVKEDGFLTHKEIREQGYSWLDMSILRNKGFVLWRHKFGEWEYTYSDKGKEFVDSLKG